MQVTQEPIEEKGSEKKGEPIITSQPASTEPSAEEKKVDGAPPLPPKQEPVVKEIKAQVDLSKKPAELKEPITLMDSDDFFKKQTNPTEGDLKSEEEKKKKTEEAKEKLGSSSTPPSSSSSSTKTISPEKRQKQAEKWVKAIDLARLWFLKEWSGQADDVGLTVHDSDKKELAEALADVMEEYDFNPAPLLTLATMTVATFGSSVSNAYESRKKIRAFRKENPDKVKEAKDASIKLKPDLDPASGQHKKRRGGQFKA